MENNTKDKIDLLAIMKTLWKNKRLFGLSCGVAFVVGAVVAFSIPKTYKTKVVLAPEISNSSSMSESLSDIASMVGVNLGKGGSSVDAIYPEIYPQIINSTPFLTSMFNVKVTSLDGEVKEMPLTTICSRTKRCLGGTKCCKAFWGCSLPRAQVRLR